MNIKNQAKKILVLSALFFLFLGSFAFADFNPNNLIADNIFSDTQTFGGAAGIQQFLLSKNSPLANTDPTFLQKLKEPQDSTVKQGLMDPEPNLGRLRTAAELIWDASQKVAINPQVIVVTLQKEQGLITNSFTSTADLQRALDHALGFNCTDSAGCDQTFAGFYYQLFGNFDSQGNRYIGAPASLMRSFNTSGGRGPGVDANNTTFGGPIVRTSKIGDIVVLDNTQGPPNNAPASQSVTLGDSATAALYRYTPHVYNGNYNFWKFFSAWFKYQNGTLLRINGDSTKVYIINNGSISLIPNFVMLARGINPSTANIITISATEFSDYDSGPTFGPPDDTIVAIQGDPTNTFYVFEGGIKHPASSFVLSQRKLNTSNTLMVSQSDGALFNTGAQLTPNDGTLLKGNSSQTVYIIQNGKRYILSAFTFAQYGYLAKNITQLPQAEIDSYALAGFLLPKDKTLIKFQNSPEVYQLQDQLLHPISNVVFKLFTYKYSNVYTLTSGELALATLGNFVPPPDGTFFTVAETGNSYSYKNGNKHAISSFVYGQRKIVNFTVALGLEESLDIPDGDPFPPREGTLIKGDQSSAIYVINKGQKVLLDYATWVKTYAKQKPVVLSQAEVNSYTAPNDASIQQ